jgi:hypothetical protein
MYNMPDDYTYDNLDDTRPCIYDYLNAQEKIAKVQGMTEDLIHDLGESSYTSDIVSALIRIRKVLED